MSRLLFASAFSLVVAAAAAAPAQAQGERAPGMYGVVRAGAALDSDLKLKKADVAAPATVRRDEDFKPGFTGEVGAGYDSGGFRLEGTVGYSNAELDQKRAAVTGFTSDGRAKALTLGLAGYADIPTGSAVTPYVGGGIGATRVDARFSRIGGMPAASSRFAGKDWGFQWHLDAGVGIRAAANTTVELGARYTQVSALDYKGFSGPVGTGAVADGFKPKLASTSVLLGLRQLF